MADLRGQQLKDSYQNVVTRGTGNKLENGNGVEFADLDDKASLSMGRKQQIVNKGCVLSKESEDITLDENVTHLHVSYDCSSGASRRYGANIINPPTENGSILYLTAHGIRENTDGVSRRHGVHISIEGEGIVAVGEGNSPQNFDDYTGVFVSSGDTYESEISCIVIKTSDGWIRSSRPFERIIQDG